MQQCMVMQILALGTYFLPLTFNKIFVGCCEDQSPMLSCSYFGAHSSTRSEKNSIKFSKQETTIRNRSKTNAAQIRCTGTSWHFGSCRCRCRSFPAWTDSKRRGKFYGSPDLQKKPKSCQLAPANKSKPTVSNSCIG